MYVDARDNYSETELKSERVFASSGSMMPREAAGKPGKAASDSCLLPCLIYKWLYYLTMWVGFSWAIWIFFQAFISEKKKVIAMMSETVILQTFAIRFGCSKILSNK